LSAADGTATIQKTIIDCQCRRRFAEVEALRIPLASSNTFGVTTLKAAPHVYRSHSLGSATPHST
jgi:hypothetical protein